MNRLVTLSLVICCAAGLTAGNAQAHFRSHDLALQSNKTPTSSKPPAAGKKTPAKKAVAPKAINLSAQDLALMLEQQMLEGQAVSMRFTIKGGESVSVLADVNSRRVRIESGSMTIVSDGQTVWNHQKKSNQVTIDGLGSGRGSVLQNPKDIFLFATNYTPKVVLVKNNLYVLALTPNQKVQSILQATGGISQLTFTLGVVKDKIMIKSATAMSNGQNIETGDLSIKSLNSVSSSEFTFSQPKNARIIDLRE